MAKRTAYLPIHFRTGLRAVGIVAGRPVWPILGGDESEDAAKAAADKAAADKAAADKAAADKAAADKAAADKAAADALAAGFPPNTAIEQMTAEQQAAYWKHQARRHEDRNKAYGGLTPEQVKELKDQKDKLEYDLGSENDKKIADAVATATKAAESKFFPQLATAKIEAEVGDRIEPAKLATLLEPLTASGMEYFKAADGTVDTAKVTAYVDSVAPAKGTAQATRRGPSAAGQGQRPNTPKPADADSVKSVMERALGRRPAAAAAQQQ